MPLKALFVSVVGMYRYSLLLAMREDTAEARQSERKQSEDKCVAQAKLA